MPNYALQADFLVKIQFTIAKIKAQLAKWSTHPGEEYTLHSQEDNVRVKPSTRNSSIAGALRADICITITVTSVITIAIMSLWVEERCQRRKRLLHAALDAFLASFRSCLVRKSRHWAAVQLPLPLAQQLVKGQETVAFHMQQLQVALAKCEVICCCGAVLSPAHSEATCTLAQVDKRCLPLGSLTTCEYGFDAVTLARGTRGERPSANWSTGEEC